MWKSLRPSSQHFCTDERRPLQLQADNQLGVLLARRTSTKVLLEIKTIALSYSVLLKVVVQT